MKKLAALAHPTANPKGAPIMATAKDRAANALMAALEDWAAGLGDHVTKVDGTRYFPTRSIPGMRRAHDKGQLFEQLTAWLPDYHGLGHAKDQSAADRMAEFVMKGLPCWEEIVADPTAQWAPYIGAADRAVLDQVMADVRARAGRRQRARVQAQARIDERKKQGSS
jgi:hypothetical protein